MIKEQLKYIEANPTFKDFKDNLEIAMKELYKQVEYMKKFVELNLQARRKILKKYSKVTLFVEEKLPVEEELNDYFIRSELSLANSFLIELSGKIEKEFNNHFYHKYQNNAIKSLKEYIQSKAFTSTQTFYLGLYVGILLTLTYLCYLLASRFKIDMDSDTEFRGIFPLVR